MKPSRFWPASLMFTPFARSEAITDVTEDLEANPQRWAICAAVEGLVLISVTRRWVLVVLFLVNLLS